MAAGSQHNKRHLRIRVSSGTGRTSWLSMLNRLRLAIPATVRQFMRFASSSVICTVFDQLLAGILFVALRTPMRGLGFLRIMAASTIARLFSQALNFLLNHHLVFASGGNDTGEQRRRPSRRESMPRFLAVAVLILTLSIAIVYLMHAYLGVHESVAKLVADTLLFFLNYYLQHNWVFANEPTINPNKLRKRRQQRG